MNSRDKYLLTGSAVLVGIYIFKNASALSSKLGVPGAEGGTSLTGRSKESLKKDIAGGGKGFNGAKDIPKCFEIPPQLARVGEQITLKSNCTNKQGKGPKKGETYTVKGYLATGQNGRELSYEIERNGQKAGVNYRCVHPDGKAVYLNCVGNG